MDLEWPEYLGVFQICCGTELFEKGKCGFFFFLVHKEGEEQLSDLV